MSQSKVRYSKQRETIYEILCNDHSHPTVDTIYTQVKKIIPDISLGTVYRNLNQLAELNRINKLDFGEGALRYDAKLEPHYHFICDSCNHIQDLHIDASVLTPLIDNVQNHCNANVLSCDIVVHGICKKCLKKNS